MRTDGDVHAWDRYVASDGVLLLKRDLLDQQIIDVLGRKVVRVNDVEIDSTPVNSHLLLNVEHAGRAGLEVAGISKILRRQSRDD